MDIKKHLQEEVGFPIESQVLIYAGWRLDKHRPTCYKDISGLLSDDTDYDNCSLAEHCISKNVTLFLTVRKNKLSL